MPTVLIIEDDPDMRFLERMAFEQGGYEVSTANNGAEGLAQLVEQPKPSVILLDLMMPVMDGLTFLSERLRGHLALEVPVICVSAGGPDLLAEARRLGAAECVAKPACLDHLRDIVDRYCGRA